MKGTWKIIIEKEFLVIRHWRTEDFGDEEASEAQAAG
jgi:hypothetical protein